MAGTNGTGPGLQLWGGLECTVNRVGDTWYDQIERSGHLERAGDLALFRDLGIRKLRYGLHWERFTSAGTFDIFDPRLREMRSGRY